MADSISREHEEFIQIALANGEYEDRAHLLDEALELLKKRDQLRRDVNAGIEQLERGEGIPGDEVFARLRKKIEHLAEKQSSKKS